MGKITMAVLAALIAAGTNAIINTPEMPAENHIYMRPAEIITADEKTNTVYCEDDTGNIWSFAGIEDWQVGDGCRLYFDDNGTPENIKDDIILRAIYYIR